MWLLANARVSTFGMRLESAFSPRQNYTLHVGMQLSLSVWCGRRGCSRLFDDDENLSWRSPLLLREVSADSAPAMVSLDLPKLWSSGVWAAVAYKAGDHRALNIMRFTSLCIRCELVPKECFEVLTHSSDCPLYLGKRQISHFSPHIWRGKICVALISLIFPVLLELPCVISSPQLLLLLSNQCCNSFGSGRLFPDKYRCSCRTQRVTLFQLWRRHP